MFSTQGISMLCDSYNTLCVFRSIDLVRSLTSEVMVRSSFCSIWELTVNKLTFGLAFLSALRVSLVTVTTHMFCTSLYPFQYYVCGRNDTRNLQKELHFFGHLF